MAEQRSFKETLKYAWDEGMARHVVVSNEERTVFNLPLTVVLLIALFASPLVALGVIVALVLGYRIEMQRSGSGETMIIMDEPPLRDSFRHAPTSTGDEATAPVAATADEPSATSVGDGQVAISAGDDTGGTSPGDDGPSTSPGDDSSTASGADAAAPSPGDDPAATSPGTPPAGEGEGKPAWTWNPPD